MDLRRNERILLLIHLEIIFEENRRQEREINPFKFPFSS